MRTSRIIAVIVGVVLTLIAVAGIVGGGVLLGAHIWGRDKGGFYNSPYAKLDTASYAVTSDKVKLLNDADKGDWVPGDFGTLRLNARSATNKPLFIGIATKQNVDSYLARTSHVVVTDIKNSHTVQYRTVDGTVPPAIPQSQNIWVASSTNANNPSMQWKVDSGEWTVVMMNADGSPGVSADARAGLKTGLLAPIGAGLLIGGLLIALAAAALFVFGARDAREPTTAPATERATVPTNAVYPVHFEGRMDPNLSRWMWLVKWFLAIPHFIVLAFLWIAFSVLTIVAGFAILFTGRYPRAFFDFNVGVLRWTWRVSFYSFVIGTDKYPPFSLKSDSAYPADFAIAYPEHLSRGLVLVKWWLLAIPHYLIISIFGGGLTWWTWSIAADNSNNTSAIIGGGLIGLLAFISGVALLFQKRYPQALFDFIMGMERWSYRVMAYVSLMRDEYPPFRLDEGPDDAPLPVATTGPAPSSGAGLAPA